jgi:hypothetical protein
MAVKQVRVRGNLRWQARELREGRRLSQLCDSKKAATDAEAELLQTLRATSGAPDTPPTLGRSRGGLAARATAGSPRNPPKQIPITHQFLLPSPKFLSPNADCLIPAIPLDLACRP